MEEQQKTTDSHSKTKVHQHQKKQEPEMHELEELKKLNSELKQDYEDLKELLQRNHAEFQNYIKRVEEEKKRFVLLANEQLIQELIIILDNFEIALKHNNTEDEFSKGMKLIQEQLRNLLTAEGIEQISTTGKFNPNEQEALIVDETQGEPNVVLEELQKGYKLNGKVIRTAKVKISKKKTSEKSNEKPNGGN